ncbi:MAG: molybdenum cofactor guanylyltransferase MobA [Gammaproteobacteria bacterium]|nr:molybdenum cofactor guanylyltransferase MobA [Gammaproteobacteria bacterium]
MPASEPDLNDITAVILAGGKATRMGGEDKGLVELNGRPMIEYVIESLLPQAGKLLINANRNSEQYRRYGFEVIADSLDGFHGPLAGIASAMQVVDTKYLVTAPCDSPLLPVDLVPRLGQRLVADNADIAVANNGERLQPVFAIMKTGLLQSLLNYLENGDRKIDRWYAQHHTVDVDFSDKPETFLNINSPDDLSRIENHLRSESWIQQSRKSR